MPGADTAIELREVTKRYAIATGAARYGTAREALASLGRPGRRSRGADVFALRDLDLSVDRGELVGIVGRNGSGKSTLLKIVSRITQPTAGIARTRGRVGALLEVGTGFHPELTGRDNIFLNGSVLGMRREDVRARFDDIVDFAGISKFIDTPLKRYSTGMHLRLAFAVAAFVQPAILAVDEILAVGDLEFQRQCLGKLAEMHSEGRTVLFVSHDLGAIARQCERCVWLDCGKLVHDGPTHDVLAAYTRSASAAMPVRVFDDEWRGPVRLRSVVVLDGAGGQATRLRRGDPLTLELVIEAQQPIRGLDLSVTITDRGGNRILEEALSDDTGGYAQRLDAPGRHAVELVLPPLLSARDHVLSVWIGTERETLIDEEVLELVIEPRVEDRREWIERPRLTQPFVSWKVRRPEEARP